MTIAKLAIRDFRCLGDVALDLHPRLTFLGAKNASGKSSVCDALQWALSGVCRGTDAKGAGSKNLIRQGESNMKVTVAFSDGTYITRALSKTGNTILDPPDAVLPNKDVLACLMNGAAFLDFAHADAKKLLMSVLDVHVEYQGERLTLDQVEAKYQIAFNERRDAKAKLNAIQIPPMPTGDVPDIQKLDQKLKELREQEHALTAKEAKGGGKREALAAQLTRAKVTAEKAKSDFEAHPQVAALEAQIEAIDKATLPAPKADEATRARAELAEVAGQVSKLSDGVVWLSKHSPSSGCALSKSIPCGTPAEAFKTHLAGLKKELVSLETRQKELDATLKTLADEDKSRQAMAADRARLVAAVEKAKLLVTAALDAETTVYNLQKDLDALPAESGPSPELLTLRERIAKGEGIVQAARELMRQRLDHEDKTKAQAEAAEALQTLEAQVADLGPKGVRVEALAASIGAFETRINAALEGFGYRLTFSLEPWDVVVNGRSAELLSTSERLRVGAAFTMALAEVTGLGFCVIDGADLLDQAGKDALSALVSEWDKGQVIIAATREKPLPAGGDSYAAFWLSRNGDAPTTVTLGV